MTEDGKAVERVTFSRGYDVCIMAIDGTWRFVERGGGRIGPGWRCGSTSLTTIVVSAIVLVAWILDAAGLLDQTISSQGALTSVVVIVVGLQVAFVGALVILARAKSWRV